MRYVWLLLLLALVGYGLTGVVQVRPGERAVVRRFGRVLPNKPEPGLWIGLPWGLDRVDRVAVDKIQSVNVGYMEDSTDDAIPAGQMLTGDHNLVNVQVTIFYHVRPDEVEDYVTHADLIEPLIAHVTETVLAQWVAARTVDEVLLNAKTALPRPLKEGVQDRLAEYHVGIEIADARVNLIAPPDAVKSAFDKVVRARQRSARAFTPRNRTPGRNTSRPRPVSERWNSRRLRTRNASSDLRGVNQTASSPGCGNTRPPARQTPTISGKSGTRRWRPS